MAKGGGWNERKGRKGKPGMGRFEFGCQVGLTADSGKSDGSAIPVSLRPHQQGMLRREQSGRAGLVRTSNSKTCTKMPAYCHKGAGYGRSANWA